MEMRYRLLGDTGLRVSELCLGTMTFGEEWGWGAPKEACRKMLDTFVDAGGNFVDTADRYTNGTSERIVGELVNDDRDRFVIATKYTLARRQGDPNAAGNHRKNMMASIDRSLERLGTDYVDLYWVHAYDPLTPIEETMRGLDDLVRAGKVHHVGISDAPAWWIARANTIAEERDWTPFSAVQLRYNLLERTPERELLPMAGSLGLGVTVWGPLHQGVLTGKYNRGETGRMDDDEVSDAEREVAQLVLDAAEELGVSPARVALAWVRHQPGEPILILGATKPEQLEDNLGCLEVELPDDVLDQLDEATAVDLGFPHEFLNDEGTSGARYGGTLERIDVPWW